MGGGFFIHLPFAVSHDRNNPGEIIPPSQDDQIEPQHHLPMDMD